MPHPPVLSSISWTTHLFQGPFPTDRLVPYVASDSFQMGTGGGLLKGPAQPPIPSALRLADSVPLALQSKGLLTSQLPSQPPWAPRTLCLPPGSGLGVSYPTRPVALNLCSRQSLPAVTTSSLFKAPLKHVLCREPPSPALARHIAQDTVQACAPEVGQEFKPHPSLYAAS